MVCMHLMCKKFYMVVMDVRSLLYPHLPMHTNVGKTISLYGPPYVTYPFTFFCLYFIIKKNPVFYYQKINVQYFTFSKYLTYFVIKIILFNDMMTQEVCKYVNLSPTSTKRLLKQIQKKKKVFSVHPQP
ncbi:hypothetical protein HanPSC8_Chr08g0312981 [Helianthus annuus]|nr:hypothetical protein HanPSC8_Chr08g0312981 [Helianthus annuus]